MGMRRVQTVGSSFVVVRREHDGKSKKHGNLIAGNPRNHIVSLYGSARVVGWSAVATRPRAKGNGGEARTSCVVVKKKKSTNGQPDVRSDSSRTRFDSGWRGEKAIGAGRVRV